MALMSITGIVIRRRVDDLDSAVSFYEQLTGQPAQRFAFGGADLAAVGPFLLFTAAGEAGDRFARVIATITVDDIAAQLFHLERLGADIIAPPTLTPNGQRLIARHPDGGVFEYVGR
jgi:predicted enzyme related to lactoylglutathione lyase